MIGTLRLVWPWWFVKNCNLCWDLLPRVSEGEVTRALVFHANANWEVLGQNFVVRPCQCNRFLCCPWTLLALKRHKMNLKLPFTVAVFCSFLCVEGNEALFAKCPVAPFRVLHVLQTSHTATAPRGWPCRGRLAVGGGAPSHVTHCHESNLTFFVPFFLSFAFKAFWRWWSLLLLPWTRAATKAHTI